MAGKKKKGMKNFTEVYESIDDGFAKILDKSENVTNLDRLSKEEIKSLWLGFVDTFKNKGGREASQHVNSVNNLLKILTNAVPKIDYNFESDSEFVNLLTFVNSNPSFLDDDSVRKSITILNEYWMIKRQSTKAIPGMEYYTLKYLLEVCSAEKPLVSDLLRLNAIRKIIKAELFDIALPSLRPLLMKVLQNQTVLNSVNGQRFLGQTLILSQRLMQDIHKTVISDLSTCGKKKATLYGRMYVVGWHSAGEDAKEQLQKTCFRPMIESFLKQMRTSLELSRSGQNMLRLLNELHLERKKGNVQFITMIADCYQPFLWKYLQSGLNIYRCNAADLLFKAFPLHRPSDGVLTSERLFNQQVEAMENALRDDCHIVRIIAIREVCNMLAYYWNSFSPVQIQKLMTIISKECARDTSTADVRRMVYKGFKSLLEHESSSEYLKQILPGMADNIHDVNQRVRIAFIELLIAIKEKSGPGPKYSDLIPPVSLYLRLAEDGIKVGQLVLKLVFGNYYKEDMPVVEWTKRFIFLIKTYPTAYRNFFLFSEEVLPFEGAVDVVQQILTQLGVYVTFKATASDADDETENTKTGKGTRGRSGRGKKPLTARNADASGASEREEKVAAKECAFDDPRVVTGLFDIVTILLILHSDRLYDAENKETLFKFYETYLKYAQTFINYYKDTPLFNSIICLSGNVPAPLLRSNSITLPGYCMKILKTNQLESHGPARGTLLTILIALIKWSKGSDVLDQVSLWLDAAFETQDLNATILPRRKVRITETIQPNSVVAIQILNTLLKTECLRASILKNNYSQLFELWKFMKRIKQVIEIRLEQGEPFEDDLVSDHFIRLCFARFGKLILLLKGKAKKDGEDEEEEEEEEEGEESQELTIDYQKEMEELMDWARERLLPVLEDPHAEPEDVALVVDLYKELLFVADNMVIVNAVSPRFYAKLGLLAIKLLDTGRGLQFAVSASRVAAAINQTARLLFNVSDDLNIFSKVVPCIVSKVLTVLTSRPVTPEDESFVASEVVRDVQTNLGKVLETYRSSFLKSHKLSREKAIQLRSVVGMFVARILLRVSEDMTPDGTSLRLYDDEKDLPPIVAALLSLFNKKTFWGPMFVHVINLSLTREAFEVEDCKRILASAVVLRYYAHNDKKVNRIELRKALVATKNMLARCKRRAAMGNRRGSLLPEEGIDANMADSSCEGENYVSGALIQNGIDVITATQNFLSQEAEELS